MKDFLMSLFYGAIGGVIMTLIELKLRPIGRSVSWFEYMLFGTKKKNKRK